MYDRMVVGGALPVRRVLTLEAIEPAESSVLPHPSRNVVSIMSAAGYRKGRRR